MTLQHQVRRLPGACMPAWGTVVALVVAAAFAGTAAGQTPRAGEPPRLSEERTGTLTTREGLRLRLVADMGNVRILTQNSAAGANPQVSYRVRIEADSRDPEAQNLLKRYFFSAKSTPTGVQMNGQTPWAKFRGRPGGASGAKGPQFWVSFEVSVPLEYDVEVLTHAGNIETEDIQGRVSLVSSGGNITAGRVGAAPARDTGAAAPQRRPESENKAEALAARLETAGGHIRVRDVTGDLRAATAGGHITAANVYGNAVLRSEGGHIRAGAIEGTAQLETSGGNISVQRTGADVRATTGGGQIDFGEAAGSIRARTGGGGIRVLRMAGPTQLDTAGGSIFLTKVQSTVHASTGSGTITAWFTPTGKFSGTSQLESGQGDIVVYLPRALPLNIEATVEMGAEYHIETDPSLSIKVKYVESGAGGRALRGEGALNGGGETLRLKTVAGNIRLRWSDTDPQVRLHERQIEQQRRRLELQQRMSEWQNQRGRLAERVAGQAQALATERQRTAEREISRLEEWQRKLEQMWSGEVRVDSGAQQQKLLHSVPAVYPDVAKQARIEGAVRLRVVIGGDGAVENVRVLSGEPVLAKAAQDAVRQWRYQPTLLDGKPVKVVTTVAVEFRLQ